MKIEVTAFPRAGQGSSESRRLRLQDRVPGIIYGAGSATRQITLEHRPLIGNLKREAFHASILDLTLDGEKMQVLLRDYQMHPWREKILHIDFQRVDKNRKIRMRIPLHFVNAEICPGVKTGGGVVQHILNDVDIQCLPDDLPEFIPVDLAVLELNQTLHVNDLALPKGVEPLSRVKHENPAVVSCHLPKEIVVEEAVAAPVTEIIGEAPAEGEAVAEGAAEGEKKEAAAEK